MKRVYTSGTWDLFHVGHINVLERSKEFGDYLIVGVSTDELVESYKGSKPVIPYEERVRLISALKCVDLVVKQTELTQVSQLIELDVDVVTIGDDWKDKYLEGLEWMKMQDGKEVIYLDYTKGVSTSSIKKKIIDNTYEIISSQLMRELKSMEDFKRSLGNDRTN